MYMHRKLPRLLSSALDYMSSLTAGVQHLAVKAHVLVSLGPLTNVLPVIKQVQVSSRWLDEDVLEGFAGISSLHVDTTGTCSSVRWVTSPPRKRIWLYTHFLMHWPITMGSLHLHVYDDVCRCRCYAPQMWTSTSQSPEVGSSDKFTMYGAL